MILNDRVSLGGYLRADAYYTESSHGLYKSTQRVSCVDRMDVVHRAVGEYQAPFLRLARRIVP